MAGGDTRDARPGATRSADVAVSRDPYTGETVFSAPAGDPGAAVARAEAAQPEWAARPVEDRAGVLRAFADAVEAEADRLSELIVRRYPRATTPTTRPPRSAPGTRAWRAGRSASSP